MSDIGLVSFTKEKQDFLICVRVRRVKNLRILNSDIFVVVSFDQIHKATPVYENSDSPHFHEYFVFDTKCSLSDLMKKTIVMRVVERNIFCTRNLIIGELYIDLFYLWNTPGKFPECVFDFFN